MWGMLVAISYWENSEYHCNTLLCMTFLKYTCFFQVKRWLGKPRGSNNFIYTASVTITACALCTRKIHLSSFLLTDVVCHHIFILLIFFTTQYLPWLLSYLLIKSVTTSVQSVEYRFVRVSLTPLWPFFISRQHIRYMHCMWSACAYYGSDAKMAFKCSTSQGSRKTCQRGTVRTPEKAAEEEEELRSL